MYNFDVEVLQVLIEGGVYRRFETHDGVTGSRVSFCYGVGGEFIGDLSERAMDLNLSSSKIREQILSAVF